MVTITVAYKGDLHCEAVHGPSNVALATDAPLDNDGKAESFSPTDLVATALGTCMLTVMGLKARSLEVDIARATATVEKEMIGAPRMIRKLTATVRMPRDLPQDIRKQLEQAAITCPVYQSLSEKTEKQVEFVWG
ncbi:MAG: OsmC family protein [Alphaproteobacteria bacterium]|nr:OsmC family protein [Alphaproteobacteria bacterium]